MLAFALACGSDLVSIAEIRDLQAQGRFEETLEPLKAILKNDPEHHEASLLLGLAYFRTARPSLAIWPLRKAEESPEWGERAAVFEAMAFIESNNNEDAIFAASRALEKNPDNLEALGLRAQARLAATKDLEEGLADINRVFELDPENGTALQPKAGLLIKLDRLDEAGEVIELIEERSLAGDATGKGSAHWCLTNAVFAHERGDLALAEMRFEGCLAKYPEDPSSFSEAIDFYTETGRWERAEELLRLALQRRTCGLGFAIDLAARLRGRAENEEAADVLEECLDSQPADSQFDALWALVEHYEAVHDFDAAAEALRRAIPLNSDPRLAFRLVDILIRGGRSEEALAAAEDLQQEVYIELAKGRILLEQGRPRQALEHLTAGIRLWPNNPGARYYAALAAEQLGDFDRAILEYRDSVRAGSTDTDAGMRLAQLLYAQGDYQEAGGALLHHTEGGGRVRGHGQTKESLELGIKLATLVGSRPRVQEFVEQLRAIPGQAGLAVSLEAQASAVAGGRNAVVAHIRQSGLDLTDPVNIEALRTLVRAFVSLGAADRALEEVDAIIANSPVSGAFQELRAQILTARDADLSEIRLACERALKFDPNDARNLACLARVEGLAGNVHEATDLYARASTADPEEVRYSLDAAALLFSASEADAAERLLRKVLRDHPYDGRAPTLLARYWVEQESGLARALALANRAIRFQAGPEALFIKGWVQLEQGESEAALETLEQALREGYETPSVHYRLARALMAQGRSNDARDALSRALEGGDFPEREQARADLESLRSQPDSGLGSDHG